MPKLSKYIVVGVGVYLLELLIVVIAGQVGASPVWAVALSFIIGTTVSFVLQKFVTFGDTRRHHKIVAKQVLATGVLLTWNFLFSLAVTKLLQDYLPAVVIRTLALGITTAWNFYLYKTRIFGQPTGYIVD